MPVVLTVDMPDCKEYSLTGSEEEREREREREGEREREREREGERGGGGDEGAGMCTACVCFLTPKIIFFPPAMVSVLR